MKTAFIGGEASSLFQSSTKVSEQQYAFIQFTTKIDDINVCFLLHLEHCEFSTVQRLTHIFLFSSVNLIESDFLITMGFLIYFW